MATSAAGLPGDTYAIAGGEDGKRRLDLLAEVTRLGTVDLLMRAGVEPGWHCLDLGCGGGHVTIELARLVGSAGSAVGVDFDETVVSLARIDAEQAGVECDFLVADCNDIGALGAFDLVYARFLLSHLSGPDEVLARAMRAVKPGGTAVLEDTDFSGFFCWPPSQAHERYAELYCSAVRSGGGDPNLGRRLAELLAGAGVETISVRVSQPVYSTGIRKHLNRITMERIAPTLLERGLADTEEIDRVVAEMRVYAEDESTIIATPRVVQAWGTVPA